MFFRLKYQQFRKNKFREVPIFFNIISFNIHITLGKVPSLSVPPSVTRRCKWEWRLILSPKVWMRAMIPVDTS